MYREFRNEELWEKPNKDLDFSWVDKSIDYAEAERARALAQKQAESNSIKAFKNTAKYDTDAVEAGQKFSQLLGKIQSQGGKLMPEDYAAKNDIETQVAAANAQKQAEEQRLEEIKGKSKYFNKDLAVNELSELVAPGVNYKNRSQLLQKDYDDPKYFMKDVADIDFVEQFKNNSNTVNLKNENANWVTDHTKYVSDKPFQIEDKSKVIGTNKITGEPIYATKPGVSEEVLGRYLDPKSEVGLKNIKFYNKAIPDEAVAKEALKAGYSPEDPGYAVAFNTAKQVMIEKAATKDLMARNIGKSEFTQERTREKPVVAKGDGDGDSKNTVTEQRDVIVKTPVSIAVYGDPKNPNKVTGYKNKDTGEVTKESTVSDMYVAHQFKVGKSTNNMNPTAKFRNAKIISMSNNKEIKSDGSLQEVAITSVDLVPYNNKGKIVAGTKENIDKMWANGDIDRFEWIAVGEKVAKNKRGEEAKETVYIPLKHGDAEQEVGNVLKQQHKFDLKKRTKDQYTSYELGEGKGAGKKETKLTPEQKRAKAEELWIKNSK